MSRLLIHAAELLEREAQVLYASNRSVDGQWVGDQEARDDWHDMIATATALREAARERG